MLSRAEKKRIRALSRRKEREDRGLFLAEGVRVVEELVRSPTVLDLAVISSSLGDTERGRALEAALRERVDVRRVGAGELNELAETRTNQGVLVVAEVSSGDLPDPDPGEASAILALDGVQDPGNLGTLVRTAAAFGFDGVVALPGTVDPWNPKAVRASAGALFHLPVLVAGLDAMLDRLSPRGHALLGADAGGAPVGGARVPDRVVLAVGNEGAGLSGPVRDRCAGLVAVPMQGGTESLNVAVAAGILMYELTRGRM